MERQHWPRLTATRALKLGWIPLCLAFSLACGHLDMYEQPRYDPYEESAFFEDGASARPLVPGTVAQGQLLSTDSFNTGREGEEYVTANPLAVSPEVIARGRDQYNIYCVPCHGQNADGNGVTAGYFRTAGAAPASFYEQRLIDSPDGYFFEVITNGQGLMYSYASRVTPEDRWAIVAHIRDLQQNPPEGAQLPTAEAAPADSTAAPADSTAAPATDGAAPTAAPTAAP